MHIAIPVAVAIVAVAIVAVAIVAVAIGEVVIGEVVFVRGTTEAINLIASRASAGDCARLPP